MGSNKQMLLSSQLFLFGYFSSIKVSQVSTVWILASTYDNYKEFISTLSVNEI